MKDEFIPTQNYQRMLALCNELLGPALGVEIAAVVGRAGRGKTTAAEKIYTINDGTIYCLYREAWSHLELLREVTFRLSGMRPRTRSKCEEMIKSELANRRRIIMVDEADRMNLRCLNVLRNIHDDCNVPLLLIGEEALTANLEAERRLISRVRQTIAFGGVTQADVVVFFRKNLDQDLTPEQAGKVLKFSAGDFRRVLIAAVRAERIMGSSGIAKITDRIIDEAMKNGDR